MNIVLRIVWFVFVGWWVGVLWFLVACVAGITVLWYNVGLFMVADTWKVMTLKDPPREIIADVGRVR